MAGCKSEVKPEFYSIAQASRTVANSRMTAYRETAAAQPFAVYFPRFPRSAIFGFRQLSHSLASARCACGQRAVPDRVRVSQE